MTRKVVEKGLCYREIENQTMELICDELYNNHLEEDGKLIFRNYAHEWLVERCLFENFAQIYCVCTMVYCADLLYYNICRIAETSNGTYLDIQGIIYRVTPINSNYE